MSRRGQEAGQKDGEVKPRCTWWLSFSARYLVNVEDLNNVESAGNYIRHRRAPIVFRDGNSYSVVYVPAVSGEMIAHGYQMNLVLVADQRKLPVDDLARQGYLIKRGGDDKPHVGTKCAGKNDPHEYEMCVIEEDIVEDVAGFLNPNKVVKRTSNVAFSYLVPAEDAIRRVAVTPQFHVRYAPQAKQDLQQIFNMEVASAPYVLTGYLDLCGIGCTQNESYECIPSRGERVYAAIDALNLTLTQFLFGAKKSRVNPVVKVEAVVAAVSEKPFNVGPIYFRDGVINNYLSEVVSVASSFKESLNLSSDVIVIYYVAGEVLGSEPVQRRGVRAVKAENVVDVFSKVKAEIRNLLRVGGQ